MFESPQARPQPRYEVVLCDAEADDDDGDAGDDDVDDDDDDPARHPKHTCPYIEAIVLSRAEAEESVVGLGWSFYLTVT